MGEYFRLSAAKNDIVRHLIYPVPDPGLPFLGVPLTRIIGGYVTIGPNAVLALAREGYRWVDLNGVDLWDMVRFPRFWKVLATNWRSGLREIRNSLFRESYLAECRKYCPELTLDDCSLPRLGSGRSRTRRQAVFCAARETAPRNGVLGALREDWTPQFRCFRCSSQELSASEASGSAEILDSAGSGEQKTAKTPAVPPLFFAVIAPKNSDNRENRINAITKLLRPAAHQ